MPDVVPTADLPEPELDVDLVMASLRSDHDDVRTYFQALCTKLADALGARVVIGREGGFIRKRGPANRLSLVVGDDAFSASLEGGTLRCDRRYVVRGIALRTESPEFADWLAALVGALAAEARRSAATRTSLERLLA